MSGRWFTLAMLGVCVALVLVALWRRSRDTSRIRAFWGPAAAHLIQHAPKVALRDDTQATGDDAPSTDPNSGWRDISDAKGLVHLRATLVDDRYYRWPARAVNDRERSASDASFRVLRFSGPAGHIDVAIDLQQGTIVNITAGRAVEIIPASRDAISAYLRLLAE